MTLKVTILGCGTSGGVPRIGNMWGACDPANPKNRRRRCSLLVERAGAEGTTTVLVDTPPDLREQLLDVGAGWLDGGFAAEKALPGRCSRWRRLLLHLLRITRVKVSVLHLVKRIGQLRSRFA